jgi:hypothetical protein
MTEHDPKTALAKIVKYNKKNPDEHEIVGGLIKGEKAAIQELNRLRDQEPEKEKYGYYWTWINKAAAMEADARAAGLDWKPIRRKRKARKKTSPNLLDFGLTIPP